MQNLDKQITYPSFTNNSYNPQLDTIFNVSPSRYDNFYHDSFNFIQLSMNGNQLLQPNYIHTGEAATPNHALQPMQDYQILKRSLISKYSFFYTPCIQ